MNEVIYLEPDDEITGVIDRIKAGTGRAVVLVMPRGSALAQSIVNLKLLKRSAEDLEREVSLVTNDRITRNLASQVGITVYSKVSEAEKARPTVMPIVPDRRETTQTSSGIRVNTYRRYREDTENVEEPAKVESENSELIVKPLNVPTSVIEEEAEAEVETEPESEPELAFPRKTLGLNKPVPEDVEEVEIKDRPVSEQIKIHEPVSPAQPISILKTSVLKKESNMGARQIVRRSSAQSRLKKLGFTAAALVVVALIMAYLLVPSATASIQLKTEDYTKELNVSVSRDTQNNDAEKKLVPGTFLELEKEQTKTFQTTGTKDMGEKATGKITVLNNQDLSAHSYRKGSRFSSGGKVFIADDDFSVGAAVPSMVGNQLGFLAGEGSVNVTADKAGDDYNLAPTTYILEGAPSKITGRGGQMSGGVTKAVKTVGENDLTAAQNALLEELAMSVKSELQSKAGNEGYVYSDSAFTATTVSVNNTKNVGDEAESFDTTIKVKGTVLTFKEKDVRDLVIAAAQDELGSKMLVNPEKSEITYAISEAKTDAGTLSLAATFKGRISTKISTNEIKSKIRSKSKSVAEKSLTNNDTIEKVDLQIWPTVFGRTPLLTNRIKVNFDYAD